MARTFPSATAGQGMARINSSSRAVSSPSSVLFRFDVAYGDDVVFFFSTDVARAFRGREKEL